MGNEQNHERRKAANGAERREERRNATEQLLSRLFCTRFQDLITFSTTLARPKGASGTNRVAGTWDFLLLLISIFINFKLFDFSSQKMASATAKDLIDFWCLRSDDFQKNFGLGFCLKNFFSSIFL